MITMVNVRTGSSKPFPGNRALPKRSSVTGAPRKEAQAFVAGDFSLVPGSTGIRQGYLAVTSHVGRTKPRQDNKLLGK